MREKVSVVSDQDESIEFIPTDDIVEAETAGAEEDAVHVEDGEQPKGLMTVEAEDFDAERLDEAEAEELEIEADEAAEAEDAGGEEDHEADLEEVLRRHFGLLGEQPDEELTRDERRELRELGPGEFICQSCFMRRSASQLSDPAHGICVDCTANGPT
jgi:hypothetical protein